MCWTFFFFKQKTAYEMRISDWSSDVCSSDLTSTGVEQLSRLSFDLLRTKSREVQFAAQDIRGSMKLIAKLFIALPDTPLISIHGTYLAPYYSAKASKGSQCGSPSSSTRSRMRRREIGRAHV